MTLQMRHVTALGGGNYKVRMTVAPDLIGIVNMRNLTRTIRDPEPREARAKLQRVIAEFETTLAEARAELRGSTMVWETIRSPIKLEFRNLDPDTATAIRDLVLAKFPALAPALMERGGLGRRVVYQRADTPAPVRHTINREPITFESILDLWAKEKRPVSQTEAVFRSKIAALRAFLKHSDIGRVTREDLTRYKEHMLGLKNKPITVKNHLMVLKTVFSFAFKNAKITENPALLVELKVKKDPATKRQTFTLADRTLILTEARSADPLVRWAHWISHFSGARLAEITEAKTTDFEIVGEHVVLHCGTKTEGSVRRFPLHSAIIREGFLDYLHGRAEGPLFPPTKSATTPSKMVNKWLRGIGITDPRKVFHSHRHTFKTLCREARVEEEIHDAITGHTSVSVGRGYGDYPIATMAEAIERIPDPVMGSLPHPGVAA